MGRGHRVRDQTRNLLAGIARALVQHRQQERQHHRVAPAGQRRVCPLRQGWLAECRHDERRRIRAPQPPQQPQALGLQGRVLGAHQDLGERPLRVRPAQRHQRPRRFLVQVLLLGIPQDGLHRRCRPHIPESRHHPQQVGLLLPPGAGERLADQGQGAPSRPRQLRLGLPADLLVVVEQGLEQGVDSLALLEALEQAGRDLRRTLLGALTRTLDHRPGDLAPVHHQGGAHVEFDPRLVPLDVHPAAQLLAVAQNDDVPARIAKRAGQYHQVKEEQEPAEALSDGGLRTEGVMRFPVRHAAAGCAGRIHGRADS